MSTQQESSDGCAQLGDAENCRYRLRPELQPLHALVHTAPSPCAPITGAIPRLVTQPVREVRVAYWRARKLIDGGWRIHALGESLARYGFIAEIPYGKGETALVVFDRTSDPSLSAAHALANDLRWLSADHRHHLRRLIDALHADAAVAKPDDS